MFSCDFCVWIGFPGNEPLEMVGLPGAEGSRDQEGEIRFRGAEYGFHRKRLNICLQNVEIAPVSCDINGGSEDFLNVQVIWREL
jgi:hypothetical protein